jgi:hypothetical protein
MEFLSLVAVAAFDYMNHNFYHDCFFFYFLLFSYSTEQLVNYDSIIASFEEYLEQESPLFHYLG